MRLCFQLLVPILLILPFNLTSVSAQENATISGVVTDADGAVVVDATVALRRPANDQIRRTTTDTQGRYRFSNLAAGPYIVEIMADKFQVSSKEVQVNAGESATFDFRLAVSPVAESTNVVARNEIERTPGGIALIPKSEINHSAANTLKDVLAFTPGVVAQSRWGSDESQFSIRGSGLRNNFHVRGLNLLIDGIPYQEADGFSDYESLDLFATQRVEVWKGANALRYGGNSMGGAVNFVTESGETASPLQLRLLGGSYGLFKGQVATGGATGSFDYFLSLSDTEFDGYRDHSEQGRQRFFSNFGWKLGDQTSLRLNIIYANVAAKLPGSLTREQFFDNPRQADPNNVANDWGRFYNYVRVGIGLNHQIDDRQSIGVSVFGHYRSEDHPIFQTIDEDARNFGGEAHYRIIGRVGGRGNRFVAGFSPQFGNVGDRLFENVGGQRGPRTALFGTEARNYGFYFENQLDVTSTFTFVAGGRADRAERKFKDEFLSDGDRSDNRVFSAFSPKLGFVWRPVEEMQFFANVSRSYEPPLLLELTSFGAPGFLDLEAQDTWQFEFGARGQWGARANWEATFFDAEIDNEIINLNVQPFPGAPFTIPSFRNARNTRHLGLEIGAGLLLKQGAVANNDRLTWRTAYTLSRFRFVDDAVFGDNYLAGAPLHLLRTELRYEHPKGFWVAPNLDWSPATYFVNSPNTVKNDKYAVMNLRAGYDWNKFGIYVEGVNLTDRLYSASVQVDSDAGTFFQPSNGRSIIGGIRVRF
jgi:iron complex outermembrane receptor protein